MLTGIQTLPKVPLPPISLEVPSMSQLPDNSKPLQTRTSRPTVLHSYPESDYHWLVAVLDELIEFIRRDENGGVPELIENDYDWSHALLVELVDAVGESDTHPLRPVMEFVCQLINNYEEKYVPKLTELFPELAEETPIETASENKQPAAVPSKLSINELAARAFFFIGYLLLEGREAEKALAAYDMAIVLKPDFVAAYNNRGEVFQKLGKYDKAIVNLGKAIELDPVFAELYYNRGCLKGSSGESKAAIIDFDKAIELDSKNAKACYYRGIAKNQFGEYQAAILDFDKAVELGFDSVDVYFHRALAKTLLGQHNAAMSDFDTVIELKPDHVQAYNYRGILKQELGNHGDALADFNKAIHINPDYAEVYNSRGNLNGSLGQYHDALVDCTEAIRLNSEYAEAYANRGMAKVGLDHPDEARSDFQKALELAEQQNCADLKVFVENQLKQLKQNSRKPRRGGQWKGKVKIAEDFDELPESFMAFFDGEDE